MKKVLCYMALFLLTGLIILPPCLRLFYKDQEPSTVTKDVLSLLTCTKDNEALSMSYKNNTPINIKYIVPSVILDNSVGDENDISQNNVDEVIEDNSAIDTDNIKSILESIENISKETTDDTTTYFLALENSTIPGQFKQGIVEQTSYYTSKGYTCNVIK